jgi:hypothetical protein
LSNSASEKRPVNVDTVRNILTYVARNAHSILTKAACEKGEQIVTNAAFHGYMQYERTQYMTAAPLVGSWMARVKTSRTSGGAIQRGGGDTPTPQCCMLWEQATM